MQRPRVRRFAMRKVLRNLDLAAELGAKTFVMWGGREGAEYDAAKDIRTALERYREGVNLLAQYVTDKGYDIRFAIEPKPNEPRGDILLPTVGHAIAFIATLERPELFGVNPEVGHEQMAGLNFAPASPRRCTRASSSTSTSTASAASSTTRTSCSATATCTTRSPSSTCSRTAARRRPGLHRPAALRLQAVPHRGRDRRLGFRRANMPITCMLKERAAAFRADPEVQEALDASGVAELADADPREGETYDDLLADRAAFEDFDPTRMRRQAASASCACSSSPPSTCSARADPHPRG